MGEVCGGWSSWEIRERVLAPLSARHLGFRKRKGGQISFGMQCVGVEELWDRVKFFSALWGSVSIDFKDSILFCILLD